MKDEIYTQIKNIVDEYKDNDRDNLNNGEPCVWFTCGDVAEAVGKVLEEHGHTARIFDNGAHVVAIDETANELVDFAPFTGGLSSDVDDVTVLDLYDYDDAIIAQMNYSYNNAIEMLEAEAGN